MIKLTYPNKSHDIEDIIGLYNEFKIEEPEVFHSWKELEKNWAEGSELAIKPIMLKLHKFIKSKTEWDSMSAVISATGDFRKIMRDELSN